ncbi:MAG: hypothetical protein ACPGCM_01865, partial [Alteromonas oceani]
TLYHAVQKPITKDQQPLGSSSVFAGISKSIGSFQSFWASTKSIPCLLKLKSLLVWSNSKFCMSKNYTFLTQTARGKFVGQLTPS